MSVLAKLRFSTSSTRVKVWCEGLNDEEIFRRLIDQVSDVSIDFTVDNVHGWPGLQQETDPNAWLAQCHEAVIVMDGDNGRKLNKNSMPLTDMAKREQAKLRGYPTRLKDHYFTSDNPEESGRHTGRLTRARWRFDYEVRMTLERRDYLRQ
jgi:hypothetical protein